MGSQRLLSTKKLEPVRVATVFCQVTSTVRRDWLHLRGFTGEKPMTGSGYVICNAHFRESYSRRSRVGRTAWRCMPRLLVPLTPGLQARYGIASLWLACGRRHFRQMSQQVLLPASPAAVPPLGRRWGADPRTWERRPVVSGFFHRAHHGHTLYS